MFGYDDEKNTTNSSNNNELFFHANLQRTTTKEKETTQIKEKHVPIVEDKDVVFNQQQHQITVYNSKDHRTTGDQQEKQNIEKELSKLEKFSSFMIALLGLAMYVLPFLYDILK